jgi:iron(III) transport system permease protein
LKIFLQNSWLDKSIFLITISLSIILLAPFFIVISSNVEIQTDYLNFISGNILQDYLYNSAFILISVILICFFLGITSSYLVSFYEFTGVNFFKYSLLLSFAIPSYIYGYTLSAFFESYGVAYSIFSSISQQSISPTIYKLGPITGSIISLSLTLFGYVFLLTRASFINQSRNMLEVGKSLGFSNFDNFYKIILPSARPAIFVGLSLVAMETLADFGTVSFFGISTFTTGIYNSWFIFDDLQAANFLSLFLLIFILIFFIFESFSRKKVKFHNVANNENKKKIKIKLSGFKNFTAFSFCFFLFGISFLFPLSMMLSWTVSFPNYFNLSQIIQLNLNSLKLIVISTIIIIFLSLITNFGERILKSNFLAFCSSLSISGYAIPGIVVSVAVIGFFTSLDNLFEINTKSYFIGSLSGLVFGYCIRFYSISFNTIKTVYLKINNSIDESAYLLGFSKLKVLKSIHLPFLQKNFIFAFILISIEIIKELPITLILRPFNFDTFATNAFNMASNDLIEAAATPSIFIIFWSSLLIVISIKFFLIDKK